MRSSNGSYELRDVGAYWLPEYSEIKYIYNQQPVEKNLSMEDKVHILENDITDSKEMRIWYSGTIKGLDLRIDHFTKEIYTLLQHISKEKAQKHRYVNFKEFIAGLPD